MILFKLNHDIFDNDFPLLRDEEIYKLGEKVHITRNMRSGLATLKSNNIITEENITTTIPLNKFYDYITLDPKNKIGEILDKELYLYTLNKEGEDVYGVKYKLLLEEIERIWKLWFKDYCLEKVKE